MMPGRGLGMRPCPTAQVTPAAIAPAITPTAAKIPTIVPIDEDPLTSPSAATSSEVSVVSAGLVESASVTLVVVVGAVVSSAPTAGTDNGDKMSAAVREAAMRDFFITNHNNESQSPTCRRPHNCGVFHTHSPNYLAD